MSTPEERVARAFNAYFAESDIRIGPEDAHPGRGPGRARGPPRVDGFDPRLQDVHRDDLDFASFREPDREGARSAAHVEHPRGRSTAGGEDAEGDQPLAREVFPRHVPVGPDQLEEDLLHLLPLGHPRVHGRCEAGRASYTCRPLGWRTRFRGTNLF